MLRFVGYDVHKRTAVFVILDEAGAPLFSFTLPVTRQALAEFAQKQLQLTDRLVLEGYHQYLGGGRGAAPLCPGSGDRQSSARASHRQCAPQKKRPAWLRSITRIEEPAATLAFKDEMATPEAQQMYALRGVSPHLD